MLMGTLVESTFSHLNMKNGKSLHTCITVWHAAAKNWSFMMAVAALLAAILIASLLDCWYWGAEALIQCS